MERRALLAVEIGTTARLTVIAGFAVTTTSPSVRIGGGDVAHYAVYATGAGVERLASWFPWEYPALARALMGLFPAATPGSYVVVFVLLSLLADLSLLLWLGVRTRDDVPATGVWLWALAVPLLGLLPYTRYDLLVTALVMVAIVIACRRPVLAAALLSVAVGLKWWPLALLPLVVATAPRDRRAAALGAGLLPWLVAEALGVWAWGSASVTEPLRWLSSRGVQVEAPVALPQMWAAWRGGTPSLRLHNTQEFAHVGWFPLTVMLAGAVVVVVVLATTARHLACDAAATPTVLTLGAATVVAVLVATGRVLSPQYLLWVLGPLAILGTVSRSPMRRSWVVAGCVAAGLTTAVFPLTWEALLEGHLGPLLLLTARDLALVGLTGTLLVTWWTMVVRRGSIEEAAAAGGRAERVKNRSSAPPASSIGHHGGSRGEREWKVTE